jgi:hypothetical protein
VARRWAGAGWDTGAIGGCPDDGLRAGAVPGMLLRLGFTGGAEDGLGRGFAMVAVG